MIDMRVFSWLLLPCLVGCASGLRAGDAAFAEGRYREAAELYDGAGTDAAVLFREAMLEVVAGEPSRAVELLERLREEHHASPYGVAASRGLELLRARAELEARLGEREAELARLALELEQVAAIRVEEQEAHRSARERLEQLHAEGQRLQEELDELRRDNERLRGELEAIKRIDLRR